MRLIKCRIQTDKDSKVVSITKDPNEKGNMAVQFINIYSNFFKKLLPNSFFDNTAQTFTASNPNDAALLQQLGSPAALRLIFRLLGVKGAAIIDILAADEFLESCTYLLIKIQESKLMDQAIQLSKNNADKEWIQTLHSPDQSEPYSIQINQLLCRIGAIGKFRKLLRYSIPILAKINAEHDEVLINKLRGHKIMQLLNNPVFPVFLGSMFASPFYGDLEYVAQSNAFTNNAHLIGYGIEAIIGAQKVSQGSSATIDGKDFMCQYLKTAYQAIYQGRALFQAKNKKGKWSANLMLIILDNIVNSSFYIDYSHLEPIVPYQTIRHIYTVILTRTQTANTK